MERTVNIIELSAGEAKACGGHRVEELENKIMDLGRRNFEKEGSFLFRAFDGGRKHWVLRCEC